MRERPKGGPANRGGLKAGSRLRPLLRGDNARKHFPMRERPKGGSASRGGLKAGSRLRLFGAGPARHPCGGLFGSISRSAIYRVKSPIQRVHKAEIQPGVGGDAGNSRLAHKVQPVRVRRRICGERHPPSRSFPILPIKTSRTSASCWGTAGKYWRPSLNSPESRRQRPSLFLRW
jgi:hypothetical protein